MNLNFIDVFADQWRAEAAERSVFISGITEERLCSSYS